jgi:heterokaryon incompatibility protein (HET)
MGRCCVVSVSLKETHAVANRISINQRNGRELDNHVNKLMARIYQNASRTLIWLGPADEDGNDKKAIDTINRIAPIMLEKLNLHKEENLSNVEDLCEPVRNLDISILQEVGDTVSIQEWAALRLFYKKKWFKRLWVVQEFNNSSHPMSYVGSYRASSHLIALFACWATYLPASFRAHVKFTKHSTNIREAAGMRQHLFRGTGETLNVLHYARRYEATDPRDRVYAMLSMENFAQAWKRFGTADHRLSTEDVFRNAVEMIIRSEKNLRVLANVDHGGEISRPSWIVRWDQDGVSYPIWWNPSNGWNSCLNRTFDIPEKFDSNVLTVRGLQVGTITTCHKISEDDLALDHRDLPLGTWLQRSVGNNWKKFLESTTLYPDMRRRLEAFSQTLHCGIDEYGLRTKRDEIPGQNLIAYLMLACGNDAPLSEELKAEGRSTLKRLKKSSHSFLAWNHELVDCRRFFITDKGHIGMGPDPLQTGDIVCILYGGKVPFILRPESDHHLLVGESYTHGMMDGEMITKWEANELQDAEEKDFLLH